jgi:protein-disulfide isomerase
MEFSDMECPYCSEYHNSDVVGQILSKYKDVNYAFKNFPLPNHKNSGDLALYGKCIEKLSSGEKYLDFVDYIFQSPTNLSGPLLAEKIKGVLPKFSVSESDFDACVNNKENLNLVKKEFEQ